VVGTSDLSRHNRSHPTQLREPAIVDRASLEILGFIFGGVTALVIAIGGLVVRDHVGTALAVEQSTQIVPASFSARR
jgi:hypothetical protein